jgi:DNA-binding CsgD family transcriptional regulator
MMTPMLTPRQRQVAELVARGLTNKAIARRMNLSAETVKTHVRDAALRLPDTVCPDLPSRRRVMLFVLQIDREAS